MAMRSIVPKLLAIKPGGTAVVYSCTHKGTGKKWAAKVIDKTEKQAEKQNILQEVGVIFKLDHPNVIRLKEIYETDTTLYQILELVTGGELFERVVRRHVFSESDAAKCVRDILAGLKYLHENEIVHRDLKPENLLYADDSEDAVLKIADFGLSTVAKSNVHQQSVCGTPGYCAPEIIRGLRHDTAVDMWSLGVIVYILLCGYEPFYAKTDQMIFKRVLKCDYTFNSPHWDGISENAKDLIRKLLLVEPRSRLTAAQAARHPWVRGVAAKNEHLEQTQVKLQEFNARRKLKAASMDVRLAVTLSRNFSPDKKLQSETCDTANDESADGLPEHGATTNGVATSVDTSNAALPSSQFADGPDNANDTAWRSSEPAQYDGNNDDDVEEFDVDGGDEQYQDGGPNSADADFFDV